MRLDNFGDRKRVATGEVAVTCIGRCDRMRASGKSTGCKDCSSAAELSGAQSAKLIAKGYGPGRRYQVAGSRQNRCAENDVLTRICRVRGSGEINDNGSETHDLKQAIGAAGVGVTRPRVHSQDVVIADSQRVCAEAGCACC